MIVDVVMREERAWAACLIPPLLEPLTKPETHEASLSSFPPVCSRFFVTLSPGFAHLAVTIYHYPNRRIRAKLCCYHAQISIGTRQGSGQKSSAKLRRSIDP